MTTQTASARLPDGITRELVEAELRWTPQIDAPSIGVAVDNGAVTLTGEVDSLSTRLAAKNAALRVRGVVAVADEIHVRNPGSARTDTDIAEAVTHIFSWSSVIPRGKIKAEVRDHTVILTGTADWDFQRQSAEHAVEHLEGVRAVDNQITLVRRPSASDTEDLIKSALIRNANIDAASIHATASGGSVTLTGKVGSWAEKRQAGLAAWRSPNVTALKNDILVTSP